ncbi:hypothetical protein [Streptomyces tagetis]|uniref:KIND domain-containing protein n=1 Tax=Streptomyces tagetis TaxID=2820809 RepID=A0A940XHU3_9ACTN|nr:hypothetical protein [Streptomyces sp. RG38]MBQ0828661.1 hypothetical protein [Streptomyces sp. RG38]
MPESANHPRPPTAPGVSVRDLLAAGAAALAVSTPPRAPEPDSRHTAPEHREAA